MKIRNRIISFFMIVLLGFTFFVHIGLNISGPSTKAMVEENELLSGIKKTYPKIEDIYRHSFNYVTYSAVDGEDYRWFNEEGKLILSKKVAKAQFDKVKEMAEDKLHLRNFEIHLGYGYENAVYVIEEENVFLYLDFDSLDVVYYHFIKE